MDREERVRERERERERERWTAKDISTSCGTVYTPSISLSCYSYPGRPFQAITVV